ncbi:hypothetical protein TSAR_009060 [Trichomalopsis sarcophagae]|uniref:MYCBP-associated protein n=1 Tax=Trichomalopsis sarcophagae TaxID=543379 RepID=A0A232EWI7_9HYME|nr:hypothetical protein TSAR_009060 [Trichomalopsis sarcophagae]
MDRSRRYHVNSNKHSEATSKLRSQDRVPLKPCSSFPSELPAEEDRRLANWRRWLSDRQRLEQRLRRRPHDLALNAHEKVRPRNETRCLLEAAGKTEITSQDRYRGNPAFWRTAERLGTEDEGVYVQMDRAARNIPPDLTRVALPEMIRREKGLLNSHLDGAEIGYLKSKWECGDYLRKRTTELKRELQLLEPKKPELDSLVVVGKKFGCGEQEQTFVRIPVITITPPEKRKKLLSDPDSRIVLKIQDREFALENGRHFEKLTREQTEELREENDLDENKYAFSVYDSVYAYRILPKKTKTITWSLNFQSMADELCERRLVLENKGVQTVSLDWRNATPEFLPFSVGPKFESRRFFFNKNRVTILPGQKIEIPIWFRSEKALVATETWKILVEPKVYPGALRLRLWATSSGEKLRLREEKDSEALRCHLRRRVCISAIRDILEELLLAATSDRITDNVPYNMYFLESDIFQARNPTYFYHFVLVEEFKKMYEGTISEEGLKDWNLSLEDLRLNLRRIEDSNLRRTLLIRFQQLCDQCLRRSYLYDRPVCSKEKMTYWLLCAFFNEFEIESDFAINRCCSTIVTDNSEEEETLEKEMGSEILITAENLLVYREVFYVRIHCLLCDTINRICAAIDTHDYFNKDWNR